MTPNSLPLALTLRRNSDAIGVRSEEGETKVYVIEPDPELQPTPDYLPLNHKIAKSLIGKGVGAEVQLPDGSKATIEWIKPKVLHELHEVLNNYQNRFPDAGGLERVPIRPGPGGLASVLERVRDRHDATDQIGRLYDSGNVPIAVAGKMLGLDPVDTFIGFIFTGRPLHVCIGTHEERQLAFTGIRDNARKGCIVDAITLHIIRRLGLQDVVRSLCGPIGITDATALRIRQKIHELKERIGEPDMRVFWRDGECYREEISAERKREMLAQFEEDDEWITEHTEIIPAQGTKDPTAQVRDLLNMVGAEFIDDILAAEGSGRLLLSEDQTLRAVAAAEFSVAATWLQPVLMQALDGSHITREQYVESLVAFVDSKLFFISVDPRSLLQTLQGIRSHSLPATFVKLASRLGGKNADMPSHLGVAVRTIQATWHDATLTWTVRAGVVGTLLYELSKGRSLAEFAIVFRAFAQIGRHLGDPGFGEYLDAWLQGHFIKLP